MREIHPFIPANQTGKWYRNNNLQLQNPQPPADWFVNSDAFAFMPSKTVKSIFLGSFPTYEVVNQIRTSGNTEFFYGQKGNRFWPIIQMLSGFPTTTETDKFHFLHSSDFGITDILKSTDRNGVKSGDKDLKQPWDFNDILDLKSNFKQIGNIYCTSGGKGKITDRSSVSAARWLLNYFRAIGCTVTGFNVTGYQKVILVRSNAQTVWRFNLYNLLSPSKNANNGFQGQVNKDAQLQTLIYNLPQIYSGFTGPTMLRLAQWSYLLSLGGFNLTSSLSAYVLANLPLLALKFA